MQDDAHVFWDDLEVGRTARFGAYRVTREEVVEFAWRYDPQPFHLSPTRRRRKPISGG